MKLSFFALLGLCFPNATIHMTYYGATVRDAKGDVMGYVPNEDEIFILHEEYEHFEMAKRALEHGGVNHKVESKSDIVYK